MGRRAAVRAAGSNQQPWGVTCHGTRAKALACTHPSAHPAAHSPSLTRWTRQGSLWVPLAWSLVQPLSQSCAVNARPHTSVFFEKNFRKQFR